MGSPVRRSWRFRVLGAGAVAFSTGEGVCFRWVGAGG